MKRLVTIPWSHYCEKARWALDYGGMTYVEEKHLPIVHYPAKWLRRGDSLPLLVTPHGTLRDSTKIVEWVDRVATPLYPQSDDARRDVERLVQKLDDDLGTPWKLLIYWYGLSDVPAMRAWTSRGLTTVERAVFTPFMRGIAPAVARYHGLNETAARRAEDAVRAAFSEVDALLATQAYLGGAAFGAADITFAAYAAGIVLPPKHPVHPESFDAVPSGLRALGEPLRATRAGKHVERMYRDYRGAKGAS